MKVKCIRSYPEKLTLGKEYDLIKETPSFFYVLCDDGKEDGFPCHLEKIAVQSSTQIEVGSEWVATLSKQGEKTLIVLHVGHQMSLCKWVSDDREFSVKNTDFNTAYKPKPKTVTMYFYDDGIGGIMAYSHNTHAPLLFTK